MAMGLAQSRSEEEEPGVLAALPRAWRSPPSRSEGHMRGAAPPPCNPHRLQGVGVGRTQLREGPQEKDSRLGPERRRAPKPSAASAGVLGRAEPSPHRRLFRSGRPPRGPSSQTEKRGTRTPPALRTAERQAERERGWDFTRATAHVDRALTRVWGFPSLRPGDPCTRSAGARFCQPALQLRKPGLEGRALLRVTQQPGAGHCTVPPFSGPHWAWGC
ncbi:uncharacterized protein LOC118497772 [Phyllostomus discolor]|uniref:Uncharacterized protein LOC118497772 n=1 Tax=Phyllostomus discolor TaxID=89673 RepID=A0A7E6CQD8_9CHIR|nr:uncharacterized protein LOC118497772 [Phyllostomus discolor]